MPQPPKTQDKVPRIMRSHYIQLRSLVSSTGEGMKHKRMKAKIYIYISLSGCGFRICSKECQSHLVSTPAMELTARFCSCYPLTPWIDLPAVLLIETHWTKSSEPIWRTWSAGSDTPILTILSIFWRRQWRKRSL